MGTIDIIVFVAFVSAVLFVGLYKSKGENTHGDEGAADYFLAGRGLTWWLIGFSLIAANISAEQFVGMSGQGAGLEGLSVSSWEWIAAITLVVVAFVLLPYFLRSGITTIPEFLEVRYNHWARLVMTLSMMLILIGVSLIGVIYAGALTMTQLMDLYSIDLSLAGCCWALGAMAAIYVAVGGLKACAWADLLQGSALIIGGGVITYFAFEALGGLAPATEVMDSAGGTAVIAEGASSLETFNSLNEEAMHMGKNPSMPWPILLLGIWIPNFYYWGLNQYITQRILGSASLGEGQKGLVLAAGLKLVIPFVIVIPGIIAFNLYAPNMKANASQGSAATLAKYATANPSTQAVVVKTNPDAAVINGWSSDAILLAVYDDKKTATTIRRETRENPRIVSIPKADFDKASGALSGPVKFACDEADTFTKVWPMLSAEMTAFNTTITDPTAKTEKMLAYKYDTALGLLITELMPKNKGILGFVVAALLGAIVSSLAAVLNAASTLLTMDVYQRYLAPKASQFKLVTMGRIFIGVFVVLGCAVAPLLAGGGSVFAFIQKFQGFVSTGILAVFIYGLANRSSGPWAGVIGLAANPIFYGFLTSKTFTEGIWPEAWGTCHYLYSMSISLIAVLVVLTVYGVVTKRERVVFENNTTMDLTSSKGALYAGLGVCALTIALYVIFW